MKNIMKNTTVNNTKILSSETAFKSKYFEVDKVTLERDGKVIEKDILKRTHSVIVLPINERDEIYLASQFRDSYQETLLETIAGHIEIGDSPLESAKKELKEEAGLTAKTWRELAVMNTSANINDKVYIFLATNLEEGKQELEEDEDIEIVKVSFIEALEKIEKGDIHILSNIAAIFFLDRLRREGKA